MTLAGVLDHDPAIEPSPLNPRNFWDHQPEISIETVWAVWDDLTACGWRKPPTLPNTGYKGVRHALEEAPVKGSKFPELSEEAFEALVFELYGEHHTIWRVGLPAHTIAVDLVKPGECSRSDQEVTLKCEKAKTLGFARYLLALDLTEPALIEAVRAWRAGGPKPELKEG